MRDRRRSFYADYDTDIHIFSFNYPNRNISFDGKLIKQTANTFATSTGVPIIIGNRNTSGMVNSDTANLGKYYYVLMYDNDIMIRNFIPCYRKSDNVAGMYDLVNNIFYTNSGTGTFIVGADVN